MIHRIGLRVPFAARPQDRPRPRIRMGVRMSALARAYRLALACAMGLALFGCGKKVTEVASGGSGSESTNGTLVGQVFNTDGSPAVAASVLIRPTNYLRDTTNGGSRAVTPDATTDQNGVFRIDSVAEGSYAVEVRDGGANAVLMPAQVVADSTLRLAKDTLRPMGALVGNLVGTSDSTGKAYVQIYGLDRVAPVDSSGHFAFSDLPNGPIQIKPVSSVAGEGYIVPDTIHIISKDTVRLDSLTPQRFEDEDYSKWPHSLKVYLNTIAPAIKDTLLGFPLLVHLDSTHFDFAGIDSKTLRFAGAGGQRLRFEVERWDAKLKRAELWIKLDTLWGNNKDKFVTLYWGNPQVPDFSDGASVFDGYAGAWHLKLPPANQVEAHFPDASPNKADGIGYGPWTGTKEFTARCPLFVNGQFVSVPAQAALKPDSRLSIAGWTRGLAPIVATKAAAAADADGLASGLSMSGEEQSALNPLQDTATREIVDMGDNYGLHLSANGNPYFFIFTDSVNHGTGPLPDSSWKVCQVTGLDLRDDHWHYVAATYDGSNLRVYIDGVEKAKTAYAGKIYYPFADGLRIGRTDSPTGASMYFRYLDEVRVAREAWSAQKIRADYQNQKQGTAMIEFR